MRANQPASHDHTSPGPGVAAGIGAALLVVVCCAGPGLVAGGALGTLGGILGSPWVIAVAAVLLTATAAVLLRHRRVDCTRRRSGQRGDQGQCGRGC